MAKPLAPTTVGQLMTIEPVVLHANQSLDEAADVLDRRGISGAPVVDGSGSLVGVISQTDLVRARSSEYLWANWAGLCVRHLMTTPALTVQLSTPVALAAVRMERHHVHRLVVVSDADPALPIGLLSSTDLVHAIAVAARDAANQPPGSDEPADPQSAGGSGPATS
jgi:CBS domain-containing protein